MRNTFFGDISSFLIATLRFADFGVLSGDVLKWADEFGIVPGFLALVKMIGKKPLRPTTTFFCHSPLYRLNLI